MLSSYQNADGDREMDTSAPSLNLDLIKRIDVSSDLSQTTEKLQEKPEEPNATSGDHNSSIEKSSEDVELKIAEP